MAESTAGRRERLILEHLPQVRTIARGIRERLPRGISLEDLVSAGVLGLIAAIDQYNPAYRVALKTYAEHKIRGAILDSLRALDWAPRPCRKKAKQIEWAIAKAEQRLQHPAGEDEVAAELGLDLTEYHQWLVDVQGLKLGSLEFFGDDGRSQDLLGFHRNDQDMSPAHLLERSQLEQLLAKHIRNMPAVERDVLGLYYLQELTLKEVGKVIRMHESSVSHLKSQAILHLRAEMEKVWPVHGSRLI